MEKIFVGVFIDSTDDRRSFFVSRYEKKEEAQKDFDESGLEITGIIEIDTFHPTFDGCAEAVIRALASSPEGVSILGRLLEGVAGYQKKNPEP